jgi:MerR family transcriptional regulator, light-induced transcriptional regulator
VPLDDEGGNDGTAVDDSDKPNARVADESKAANGQLPASASAVADLNRPWYNAAMTQGSYRIKTVERLTGIPAATLRAWERRYSAVVPARTHSGHRVYGPSDVERLKHLKSLVDSGLSIAEAVETASTGTPTATGATPLIAARNALIDACVQLDRPSAERAVRPLVAVWSFPQIIGEVYIPALRDLGERSRAAEQFGTALIREKIISMLSAIAPESAPRKALLACPEGEQHELGLLCVALELSLMRWSVVYLGAGTTLEAMEEAAAIVKPAAICLSASRDEGLLRYIRALSNGERRVVVGGHGAAGIAKKIEKAGGIYAASAQDVSRALA